MRIPNCFLEKAIDLVDALFYNLTCKQHVPPFGTALWCATCLTRNIISKILEAATEKLTYIRCNQRLLVEPNNPRRPCSVNLTRNPNGNLCYNISEQQIRLLCKSGCNAKRIASVLNVTKRTLYFILIEECQLFLYKSELRLQREVYIMANLKAPQIFIPRWKLRQRLNV